MQKSMEAESKEKRREKKWEETQACKDQFKGTNDEMF